MNPPVVIDWYPAEESGAPRVAELNGSIFCVHGRKTREEQLQIIKEWRTPWRQTIYEGRVDYEPIE